MKKTLLLFVLLLLACVVLSGCSNGGTAEIPEDSPYIGTWEAVSADFKGEEMPLEEAVGDAFIITLNADATARIISDGEDQPGTWKITGDGISVRVGNARSDSKYTAKGDKLILTLFGVNICFAKK